MAASTPTETSNNGDSSNADINLCSSANGARVLFASDEWFATAENLLNPYPPVFVPDLYCEQGKVMDGWETRRKRTAGHDWCVIKLGGGDCGKVKGTSGPSTFLLNSISVDTAYFTGNQTPRISLEAMRVERPSDDTTTNEDFLFNWIPGAITRLSRGGGVQGKGQSPSTINDVLISCQQVALRASNGKSDQWITVLPMTPLNPGYEETRHHSFEISNEVRQELEKLGGVTHLKLNYYPDGGVARMKVWGRKFMFRGTSSLVESSENESKNNNSSLRIHPHSSTTSSNPPPSSTPKYPHPELSSELFGGLGLACSNKHYGIPSNLLRPTPGKDMGDGWETARHPDRPPIVTKDPVTGLQDTPLMDWSVLKLGMGGAKEREGISRIIVDTRHFKGNFPESVSIDGCYADPNVVSDEDVCASAGTCKDEEKGNMAKLEWFPLLKRTALVADAEHEYLREFGHIVNGQRAVTHIRVSIFPDGGLSRVRVYGSPAFSNSISHL